MKYFLHKKKYKKSVRWSDLISMAEKKVTLFWDHCTMNNAMSKFIQVWIYSLRVSANFCDNSASTIPSTKHMRRAISYTINGYFETKEGKVLTSQVETRHIYYVLYKLILGTNWGLTSSNIFKIWINVERRVFLVRCTVIFWTWNY